MQTLEKKIDEKLDPLWNTVFEEEVGLQDVVKKLENAFYEEDTGVKSKVLQLEQSADYMSKNYDDLVKELDAIKSEQEIIRGYVTKHEDQIVAVQDKTTDIIAKSMENNISISGIEEQQDENCLDKVKQFLEDELRIENIDTGELYKIKEAFRVGVPSTIKPRVMIVKCNQFLRKKILDAAREYRERQGRNPLKHHVNTQLPDKLAEQSRFIRHIVWEQKQKDQHLPYDQKAKIQVQNNIVYINKKPVKRKLPRVRPHHMFQDDETQRRLDDIEFCSSETKLERNSLFQAHIAKCDKAEEAHLAQVRIRQLYPASTHVITAFNPPENSDAQYAIQDDGEHGAALKILRFLQDNNHQGIVVCITRIYGGYHLGPRRFQIMLDKTKEAFEKMKD